MFLKFRERTFDVLRKRLVGFELDSPVLVLNLCHRLLERCEEVVNEVVDRLLRGIHESYQIQELCDPLELVSSLVSSRFHFLCPREVGFPSVRTRVCGTFYLSNVPVGQIFVLLSELVPLLIQFIQQLLAFEFTRVQAV
ncbi:hypothetical protein GJR99_17295 [Haloferax sp. MBLA0078]|uniref:Uncharacterized protein n=1 Tax=Haloferax marinum TaxID=2666143 RepID=A0A6A8GB54_9EURY|nr:hypothetical protein Hfx1150_17285 [Haloferax sp. CBA1150]MRW98324.1 hypothetical protein [Haloferax marinum]